MRGMVTINFEWLFAYKKIDDEMDEIKINILKTEIEIERWAVGDLRKVHIVKESKAAKLESNLARMIAELDMKKDLQNELLELIEEVGSVEDMLIKKRYIEGKPMEWVAEELNLSAGHVKGKNAELRKELSILKEWKPIKRYRIHH